MFLLEIDISAIGAKHYTTYDRKIKEMIKVAEKNNLYWQQ
jgi:hypothetical protein